MGRGEWFSDCAQWEAAQARKATVGRTAQDSQERSVQAGPSKRKGLSYKEQKEWDQIEEKTLKAEEIAAAFQAAANDPAVASSAAELQDRYAALHAAQAEVKRPYTRWAELDKKRVHLISSQS